MDRAQGARRPFLLRPRKGGLIAFAAIWERWRDRDGGEIDTVAIITCDANATVAALHDRMPVVLGPEHFEAWLDCKTTEPKAAQEMLQPAPDDVLEAIEMHPDQRFAARGTRASSSRCTRSSCCDLE